MRLPSGIVVVALVAGSATAHVQPSIDDNDRYLKLTLLGDRVRLAYTLYFGEVPAAALRRRMDANRDGQLATGEADAFGRKAAAEIQPNVSVTIDGVAVPVTWAEVDVGLGTPTVQAGSFAIDMVAWLCLPAPRGHHELVLRDHYVVADPGEIELVVDPGIGVKVERITLGGDKISGDDTRFRGGPPLGGDDGWVVAFAAGGDATITNDGRCHTDATSAGSDRRWWIALAIAIGGGAVIATALVLRARRAPRTSTDT